MRHNYLEVFDEQKPGRSRSLDWLLAHILHDSTTAQVSDQLEYFAEPPPATHCTLAVTFFRVMRHNLRSGSFRDYWRCCTLFENEIRITGQSWKLGMAFTEDWDSLSEFVRARLEVEVLRIQLRAAVLLPGGREVCDSVAFRMFALTYDRAIA